MKLISPVFVALKKLEDQSTVSRWKKHQKYPVTELQLVEPPA